MCARFSLLSGFLCIINTCTSKFVQFGCRGGRIGFMRRGTLLWGGCGVGLPPVCFVFLFSWSYLIAFSPADSGPACPVTHLLSSQTFVKRGPLPLDYYFGFSGYNTCAGRQTLGYRVFPLSSIKKGILFDSARVLNRAVIFLERTRRVLYYLCF